MLSGAGDCSAFTSLQGKLLSDRGMMFFGQYQEALRSRNLADFDDLITLTERLLRTDEQAAAELRSRWDYVLVDEFQDLNPTQYGIVRRLAEQHRCLFGVGDDEQSIFSWTGADPASCGRFREDFDLREPIVLDENRRCSVQILDSARRLIACNPVLFEKQIDTTLESPFEVVARGFENEEDRGRLAHSRHPERSRYGARPAGETMPSSTGTAGWAGISRSG